MLVHMNASHQRSKSEGTNGIRVRLHVAPQPCTSAQSARQADVRQDLHAGAPGSMELKEGMGCWALSSGSTPDKKRAELALQLSRTTRRFMFLNHMSLTKILGSLSGKIRSSLSVSAHEVL
eukprot:3368703-Amphidinium_carterae.1